MKYLLSLLVCLLLPLAYADEIRIAMEGKYPPFEELDTKGQLHGFNVEIAKALCAEMQAKCIISHVDWNELIPDLRNNKIDAVLASMPITEDRLKLVDFTDKYTQTPASFFARDHRFPYAYLDARRLAKARIGVVSDSVNDNYITAKFGSTSTIVHFKSPAEMYQALVNNNIDLFFDDLVSGNRNFVQMPMGAGFNFIGAPVIDSKFFGDGQGIAVRKGDHALQTRFNTALKAILDNGKYEKIERKYFLFNVY